MDLKDTYFIVLVVLSFQIIFNTVFASNHAVFFKRSVELQTLHPQIETTGVNLSDGTVYCALFGRAKGKALSTTCFEKVSMEV